MTKNDIILHNTCDLCPEQYDAVNKDGKTIGYLRLRHGYFTVECPDVGGKVVYDGYPDGDGCFEEYERDAFLESAKEAIAEYWNSKE